MAGQRRAKMDLDRARRAKQAAKRERRLEKGEGGVDDVDGVAGDGARPSGEELLAQLSDLARAFRRGRHRVRGVRGDQAGADRPPDRAVGGPPAPSCDAVISGGRAVASRGSTRPRRPAGGGRAGQVPDGVELEAARRPAGARTRAPQHVGEHRRAQRPHQHPPHRRRRHGRRPAHRHLGRHHRRAEHRREGVGVPGAYGEHGAGGAEHAGEGRQQLAQSSTPS